MSAGAIVMMIIAMVIVWGGLVASIVYLRMRPEKTDSPFEDPDLVADDTARSQMPHPTRDT
ncbi:methionine/alanine import family NSS transporter small subunit [Gordonia sp. LSe1-13]|uniref:Methionine/alanine import family NSS transporter small subunit n=1 Tax=Gordonia sesuvii TaxID=3116777 RepID=A0ABU7MD61_9ACTN|nr:methionine/alanine import family NSS transporter small subunit [Gordonia sp. LSe1-13]